MRLLERRSFVLAVAATACGMSLSFDASPIDVPGVPAAVTSVIDGDTIKVQTSEGPVLVRLADIDAPEPIQPGGGAATRALHAKLLANEVALQVRSREGERLVAVVYLGDENVNAWMVKQGHAWADRGGPKSQEYCLWEKAARSLRRGLWAEKHWVAPWDFRLAQRDALHFVTDYSHASAAGCMRESATALSFDD